MEFANIGFEIRYEHFIVGAISIFCILLVSGNVLIEKTNELNPLFVLLVVPLCLFLGSFINLVADIVFWPIRLCVYKPFGGKKVVQEYRRLFLDRESQNLLHHARRLESKAIIFRGNSLNFCLCGMAVIFQPDRCLPESQIGNCLVVSAIFFVVSGIMQYGYFRTHRGYCRFLNSCLNSEQGGENDEQVS